MADPPGNLPAAAGVVQTAPMDPALVLPALLLVLAAVAAVAASRTRRRGGARREAVARLLDAADALETRLRAARDELEAVTGEAEGTRGAMQEMLRQRLWLQRHGQTAPLQQIDAVRESLEQARLRIDRQLSRVEDARTAPLA